DGLVDPQSNYGILSSSDTQTWKRQIAANAVFSSRQPQKTDYEYEDNGVDHFFMFCFQIGEILQCRQIARKNKAMQE
ncbi:MAG: hypothetical protein WCJ75_14900, partial [Desulfomonile sp.]